MTQGYYNKLCLLNRLPLFNHSRKSFGFSSTDIATDFKIWNGRGGGGGGREGGREVGRGGAEVDVFKISDHIFIAGFGFGVPFPVLSNSRILET